MGRGEGAKVYQLPVREVGQRMAGEPEANHRAPDRAERAPYASLGDRTLVERAQAGDQAAFEVLYARYLPKVRGLAFMLSAVGDDLEEAVQETFVGVLASLAKLRDGQAFSAWIGSITARSTQKVLRRRYRRERLGLISRQPIEPDSFVAPHAPPDVALELRRLYAAIDQLPPRERVALLLRRVGDYTNDEVAKALGVSQATAKRLIVRAAQKLEGHA